MQGTTYASPPGGLPHQNELTTSRAVFTNSYAVIPKGVMRDIVTSKFPDWTGTRAWIIARPLSGFAETFSQYIMEVEPGGGSEKPEPDIRAEAVLFVTDGIMSLTLGSSKYELGPGGYVYIPPNHDWTLKNTGKSDVRFHWIRKIWKPAGNLKPPESFVKNESEVAPNSMPNSDGKWATTMFVDPDDLRHDMHVNIVTLEPGAAIPFMETHVMEHGLYVLEGKGVYRLNDGWVEVEAGDFMWLRAFCPQACYAGGPQKFRYLLYKDVNRHAELDLFNG